MNSIANQRARQGELQKSIERHFGGSSGTLSQVASFLGVSILTVRRRVTGQAKKLPALKAKKAGKLHNSPYMVKAADLAKHVAKLEQAR